MTENIEKLKSNNKQKNEQRLEQSESEQENLSLEEKRKEKIRDILAASPIFKELSDEEVEDLIQIILSYLKGKEDILDKEDVSETEE